MALEIKIIIPKVEKLARKYEFDFVALFGSEASGKTHKQSDVDMAFSGARNFSPMEIARMQSDFSEELGIKDLELVNMKDAPPLLLKQVALKSRLIYEKNSSGFALFKIYAFKRYMEARKLLDLRELQLNRFLSQKT